MPTTTGKAEDTFVDDLVADLGPIIYQFCTDLAEDEKFRLSRTADTADQARGNTGNRSFFKKKFRSQVGEPPRRDTGRLQASITPTIDFEGDTVTGTVTTDVPYAVTLVVSMGRLILTDRVDPLSNEFLNDVAEAL